MKSGTVKTLGYIHEKRPHDFKIISPVMPYQGSKRKLVDVILGRFPPNSTRVVEPFAGSAAVSIHALLNNRASVAWINDAHEPLMGLWKEVLYRPSALAANYSQLWHEQGGKEQEFFNMVRERFNEGHAPADFLYLLARCVKAAVRFNRRGEFNNSPDRRRLGARPVEMERRIMETHAILSEHADLTAKDYRRVTAKCTVDDLVYMDPPYRGTCGNHDRRYCGEFDHGDFRDTLEDLKTRHIPFILSYDGYSGNRKYGNILPRNLKLQHVVIQVGRSTQSTLLGGSANTCESLYISPDVGRENRR